MTTIEDTLTYINGAKANGRLVVGWKPFTVGGVNAAGGELEWPIVDGEITISLYSNSGALPNGSYYVAKYELENGQVYLEQWIVPDLPVVSLGQVRVSFPPTPSVMISPTQLTSLNAQPGMFLMWDGQKWVPAYPSTFNLDPNWIAITMGTAGNDVAVIGSPVHLGNSVTINIPDARPTARGVVTTSPQSIAGVKTFLDSVNIGVSVRFALQSTSPVYGEALGSGTGGADSSLAFGGNFIAARVSPVDRTYVRADSFIGSRIDLESFGDAPTAVMPGSLVAPARALATFLLPVAAGVDWTGIGNDTTGKLWLRTGTSTAAGFLYLDTAGNVTCRELRMDPYQHLNAPGEALRSDATMVMYSGASDWAGYGVDSTPEIWFRIGPNAGGTYYHFGTGGARFPNLSVDNITVSGGVTLPPGTYVPTSRQIIAGTGLAGGGDLSVDRMLLVVDDTTTQRVQAASGGILVAARRRLNFIAGTDQLITVVDNPGANQVDLTFTATTGGSPSPSVYSIDGAVIGTRSQLNLITGANMLLTGVDNAGAGRVDITIAIVGGGGGMVDPTTTKGDIIARGATAPPTRLGVGTDAQVLTADSASPLGIKWATAAGGVPPTRLIIAGVGLGGGGSLAADVTLTADVHSVNGRVGAVVIGSADIIAAGGVPSTRQIIASTGLTGGGPLSADVTLAVVNDTTTQRVRVSNSGTLIGTRQQINLIQGANVALTTSDDPGNNRVNVTVAATTSGLSDPTTTKGDMIARGVAGPATRLPVGSTDGLVLTVDAAQALGVRWAAVPLSPQTPWASDIDGAGFKLKNVFRIGVGNDFSVAPDPAPLQPQILVGAATGTQSGEVIIASNVTAASGLGGFAWANYANGVVDKRIAAINGRTGSAINSGDIQFYTWNAGAAAEKMCILANGNVGIATTAPVSRLQVNDLGTSGNTGNAATFNLTADGANGVLIGRSGVSNPCELWLGVNQASTFLDIQAAQAGVGFNRLLVLNRQGGNVGVGGVGTSPSQLFTVRKDQGGVATAIMVDNGGSGTGTAQAIQFGYGGMLLGGIYHQQGSAGWQMRFTAWSNSAEVERLTIDGVTGNVGIGVTNPRTNLAVINAASTPSTAATATQFSIGENSNNTDYRLQLGFFYEGGGYKGVIQATHSGPPSGLLCLQPLGGRACVGTSTPYAQFQVTGSGQADAGGAYYDGGAVGGSLFLDDALVSGFAGGALLLGCAGKRFAAIKGNFQDSSNNGVGFLQFLTRTVPTDSSMTVKMHLGSNGRVGIGTQGPQHSLDVVGDINCTGVHRSNGVPYHAMINFFLDKGASRSLNVVYQNTQGVPIFVSVTANINASNYMQLVSDINVSPVLLICVHSNGAGVSAVNSVVGWVMPNHYYKVNTTGATLQAWFEWQ